MRRFALTAATAALAASVVAAPAAAHASSTIYPPSNACTVSEGTLTAGATTTFGCADATFAPNETVTITVRGENGAGATFGFVKFAISTGSTQRTSTSTGALEPVSITLPADASGVYNIEAISATSAGGTSSTTISSEESPLAITGADNAQQLALWAGGGAALLAAGAVALGVTAVRMRRRRAG